MPGRTLSVSCGYDDPNTGRGLLVDNGASLLIDIGFDKDWNPKGVAPPKPIKSRLAALIDTGAYQSHIDTALATELKLPIVDARDVIGVHGPQPATFYLAQVHFPALKFAVHGEFAALPLIKGGIGYHALLGRTFLQHFRMEYNGVTGAVTIYRD
jgi:hypothetical protein